ncbi:MAG: hypothetical protein AAGA32_22575, partial [Pseudomonadota bacterium]
RSELMTLAWMFARQDHWSLRMPKGTLHTLFPDALRRAWAQMKSVVARRAERLAELGSMDPEALRRQIIGLENTDTLGAECRERLAAARRALAEISARDYAAKRDLIASAGGRICAVTFTKQDGTERVMKVQPAKLKFHVKGDAATDAGRKGAETRAARHPNLLPVWDVEKAAPRSVNLATISRIAVDGVTHTYA